MVEIILVDNEKKIIIEDEERSLYEELGYVDYRGTFGEYLRKIEVGSGESERLENFYTYKGVPLYIFMRPAFSGWLNGLLEKIYILDFLKKKYIHFKIKTDDKAFKDINDRFFGMEVELVKQGRESKVKRGSISRGRLKRIFKGFAKYAAFKFKRGDKVIMYSTASTIARDSSQGAMKDVLYGELQGKLQKYFTVLNIQILQNDKDQSKSDEMKYETCPMEFFAFYKRVFHKTFMKEEIHMNLNGIISRKFHFLGYDISSEIHGFFSKRGKDICRSYLNEIIMFERMFKKNRVKKVVVIDEGDRGRCLISAARISGIDSFALQHGIIVKNSHSYHLTTRNQMILPNKTFLWGEKYKRILCENTPCYNNENLAVVGNIRMRKMNVSEKIQGERMKILFISQYMDELVYGAGEIFFEAMSKIEKDVDVIIKLHPTDSKYDSYYREKIESSGISGEIVKEHDLYDLFRECDCVVSVHSSAVLESACFNKPSVCIRLPKFDDVCDFVREGMSIGAYDSRELRDVIMNSEEYFTKDYYQKMANYIQECFYTGKLDAENMILNEIRG